MATIESYSGDQFPYLMCGAGTAGDLMYMSTGSGLAYKSGAGTGNSNAFIGVLCNTTAAGSYAAVQCDGVAQLQKHAATQKIEAGDVIYGTKSSNLVGTLAGGTSIGICVKQSATTDTYVETLLMPYFVMRGGYHA